MFKSKLLRNSFFSSFSWGANVLINLVAIPVIVHYLGVEGFGIYALLTGLFGYFGLLDLGLGQGVIKFVAHHRGINDDRSLIQSVNAALVVQATAGGIGLLVLWFFNPDIIQLLNVSANFFEQASSALYIAAIGFFVTMLMGTFSSTLAGLQRYDLIGKTNISFSVLTTVAILAVLVLGGRLVEVIAASFLMTVLNFALYVFLVFRLVPAFRITWRIEREHLRSLFSFSSYIFAFKLSSIVNNYFVRFIISFFLGPQAVAYFVIPLKLVTAVQSGLESLVKVLFPYISELSAQGNTQQLQSVYLRSSRLHLALAISLYLFVAVFSTQILSLWMGLEFSHQAWHVLTLLTAASFIATWTMIPTNTIFGMGHSKLMAVFSVVSSIVSGTLMIWLTPYFGITGTALAIFISTLQGPIFVWYVTDKVIGIPWASYLRTVANAHLVWAGVILAGAIILLRLATFIVDISSYLILGVGVTFLVLYLSYSIKSESTITEHP